MAFRKTHDIRKMSYTEFGGVIYFFFLFVFFLRLSFHLQYYRPVLLNLFGNGDPPKKIIFSTPYTYTQVYTCIHFIQFVGGRIEMQASLCDNAWYSENFKPNSAVLPISLLSLCILLGLQSRLSFGLRYYRPCLLYTSRCV